MKKTITTIIIIVVANFISIGLNAQDIDRPGPAEWANLIKGARFMDRYEAMPDGKLSNDVWGCYKVHARFIDNGIETPDISFWGGNIMKDENGKYHLYLCGWPESAEKGHFDYVNSVIYNTESDNLIGPYHITDTIGKGHNPTIIKTKDGSYVLYCINDKYVKGTQYGNDKMHRPIRSAACFVSKSLNGPWKLVPFQYDFRDRIATPGKNNWDHNFTFTRREDGSSLAINRGGQAWVSKDGISTYNLISDEIVYPAVSGKYEDPVVWRDNVQYNLIVNDWLGRVAHYMRSPDGIHWTEEEGEAYVPGVSFHKDGFKENWYKYERIRIYQDEYGRAIQANFAVIDTSKFEDHGSDNHSSKNISIPMNPGMLIYLQNKERITRSTKEIKVLVKDEANFHPAKELDFNSLHFGAASEVNYGRGAIIKSYKVLGNGNVELIFNHENNCITDDIFAPKMIGHKKDGSMVFGYCRKPWMNYNTEILSARKPIIKIKGNKIFSETLVDNYGQVESKPSFMTISLFANGEEIELASATIPRIKAYAQARIKATHSREADVIALEKGKTYPAIVKIFRREGKPELFHTELKL